MLRELNLAEIEQVSGAGFFSSLTLGIYGGLGGLFSFIGFVIKGTWTLGGANGKPPKIVICPPLIK